MGREKKVHAYERKREREKVRGREKENERGISVRGVGVRGVSARGTRGGAKVTAKQAAVRRTKRARG